MIVYFLMLAIPTIPAVIYMKNKNDKYRKAAITLFFISLMVILSLRSNNVGADLSTYEFHFNRIKNIEYAELFNLTMESGFAILNKLAATLSDSFRVIIITTSVIAVLPIYLLYKKEAKSPYLSIILFANMPTFVILFLGLRQAIAIAIGAIAYHFVVQKKLVWFIALVIIASLFHQSATILLILYPLFHSQITKKWLWFIIPSICLIYVYNKQIFSFLTYFLSDKYIDRYGYIQNTGSYAMIILFVLFLLFSYIMIDEKTADKTTLGLRNIMVFVVIMQLFAPINNVAMRFNYYFIIFVPILISRLVDSPKKHLKAIAQISNVVMISFFIIYFFYNAYKGNDILHVFPYELFWES